jgi:RsmE family RNA methyltransferase
MRRELIFTGVAVGAIAVLRWRIASTPVRGAKQRKSACRPAESKKRKSQARKKLLPHAGHMNLILLNPREDHLDISERDCDGRIRKCCVHLTADDVRVVHIRTRLKCADGALVRVGIVGGLIGEAIIRFGGEMVKLDAHVYIEPPPKAPVVLIMAMARPTILVSALICAVCMGVKNIYLINSARTEPTAWATHLVRQEDLETILLLGLGQARDTQLPKVMVRRDYDKFIRRELPTLSAQAECYIAHPPNDDQGRSINSPSHGGPSPEKALGKKEIKKEIVVAVGPEGGFVEHEVNDFLSIGFSPLSLGERILKVEHAIPAVLSYFCLPFDSSPPVV